MGYERADGIWIKGPRSEPPYSKTRTVFFRSSDRRLAITDPAEPEPMMIKSYSFANNVFVPRAEVHQTCRLWRVLLG